MRVRQRTRSIRAAWAPSLARRVLRHRVAQAGTIVVVGVVVASSLAARIDALERERAAWGETTTVAVVVDPVLAGGLVHSAVTMQALPREMVPPTAVTAVADTSRAKVALYPGEIVLADRVTGSSGTGRSPDTAALTLQVVMQVPLVTVGDLVDLWSIDSANQTSQRVAEQVVVLALTDRTITVAVPNGQIAEVTIASLRPVTVSLVG